MALHLELNYEKTGYVFIPGFSDFREDIIDHSIYFPPLRSLVQMNNITLPVSLKLNFISNDKIRVFVNAGNYINYTYSYNITDYYSDGVERHRSDTRSYKRGNNYDLGALLGLGTDITLNKHIHLTLEIRDHLNLRGIRFKKGNALGLMTGLTYEF
jgi:hypothetical protein